MEKLEAKEFMEKLPKVLKEGGSIYHRASFPLVHVGIQSDINEEYCTKNKIPIFRVQRAGGTIVSNVGDFDFVKVNKYTNMKNVPSLLANICILLNTKGFKAEFQENDLLAEGYKVASYSRISVPGGVYTAMHISMSVNMDLIKNICKKEMIKVPRGLNDFGIYEEDILKLMEM